MLLIARLLQRFRLQWFTLQHTAPIVPERVLEHERLVRLGELGRIHIGDHSLESTTQQVCETGSLKMLLNARVS